MSGSNISYQTGTKNNWRSRVWNDIVDHCIRHSIPKKEAIVLVLAGPEGNDLLTATKKGFDPHNIIGVDLVLNNVKQYRQRGIAIQSDLHAAILGWQSPSITAIVADYCSGLTCNINTIFKIIPLALCLDNTRIICNFLRGRDGYSNDYRLSIVQKLQDYKQRYIHLIRDCPDALERLLPVASATVFNAPDPKHRGLLWLVGAYDYLLEMYQLQLYQLGDNLNRKDIYEFARAELPMRLQQSMAPVRFFSYKRKDKGNIIMDAVAITVNSWPGVIKNILPRSHPEFLTTEKQRLRNALPEIYHQLSLDDPAYKIAALKAIRTQKTTTAVQRSEPH